ncbi:Dabb family protein [Paenibacillus albidus]|uniref:Dabb family protein n=1 Tax=Paenibacillus albidus TaxID=2041023 RepID=UPI001BE7E1DA|nr:Dabb family protein [Paenibacillus albidus]MBT2289226.1 Dabb family protein [Paenibacillus albidus]
MYEHLVVFKFNSTITPVKQQEFVDRLLSLRGRIPGILELSAGINVTEESDKIQGYTLGLRVTFDNLESLRAYGPHPAHQDFVASLDGWVDDVIVADYPIKKEEHGGERPV